jgi:hypothetical protein
VWSEQHLSIYSPNKRTYVKPFKQSAMKNSLKIATINIAEHNKLNVYELTPIKWSNKPNYIYSAPRSWSSWYRYPPKSSQRVDRSIASTRSRPMYSRLSRQVAKWCEDSKHVSMVTNSRWWGRKMSPLRRASNYMATFLPVFDRGQAARLGRHVAARNTAFVIVSISWALCYDCRIHGNTVGRK